MFMLKSRRIYISFLFISSFSKIMFNISKTLVWLVGLYIILTVIGVVLDNRISKTMFLITCFQCFFPKMKKVFLHVTNITSNIASNTSTISVSVTSKSIIVIYLDFPLKNRFFKLRFNYPSYPSILPLCYITGFINFWKKTISI